MSRLPNGVLLVIFFRFPVIPHVLVKNTSLLCTIATAALEYSASFITFLQYTYLK